MSKRSFDASLFFTENYAPINPDESAVGYERDDFSEMKKHFDPDASIEEQQQFEKELEDFVETQPTAITTDVKEFVVEFSRLKAYAHLRDDVYERIKQHPHLVFCEQGLEDVCLDFKDEEDLERYLRSMAGIQVNIKQDPHQREQERCFECRFVTKVVQEAEMEDVDIEDVASDSDEPEFDATSMKGSESIKSILEAANMDDLTSCIEDYCIINIYYSTEPLRIQGWELRILEN